MEKKRAEFKILAQKNKKEDWVKFASSFNCNTPINQTWNKVGQLDGNDPKKVTIFEVNREQYKNSNNTANKICDMLTELYLPQNYVSTYFELKQREEQKTTTHFLLKTICQTSYM